MCAMFPDCAALCLYALALTSSAPAVNELCSRRDRPDLTSEMLTEGCGAVQETVTRKETETKLNLFHLAQVFSN